MQRMQNFIQAKYTALQSYTSDKVEVVQGFVSYVTGGGLITMSLSEIATLAQSIGIILGCLVVVVRLMHDTVSFIRHIKNKKV